MGSKRSYKLQAFGSLIAESLCGVVALADISLRSLPLVIGLVVAMGVFVATGLAAITALNSLEETSKK